MLRESDGDNFFFGIDLAISGGSAVPAELAGRGGDGEAAGVGDHLDAEAKAAVARGGLIIGKREHVIGGHELDGFSAEDAFAVESAAVAEHLCKARKIIGGGKDSRAAGLDAAAFFGPGFDDGLVLDEFSIHQLVGFGGAVPLSFRYVYTVVLS